MRIPLWQVILFLGVVIFLSIRLFPSGREMGLFYYKSKNYNQVEEYLAKQFRGDPTDLANAFRYLSALRENGKFKLLEKESKKLLETYPENYEVHEFMAGFFDDQLMSVKASEHWIKMLELRPHQEDIVRNLAYYYFFSKDYSALIELYERELPYNADDPDFYYDLARFYSLSRNLPKTKEVYELLVKNFPKDIEAKRQLAQILEIMGEIPVALSLYRDVAQEMSKNEYNSAELLEKLLTYHEEKEALELAQQLIERFQNTQPLLEVVAGFFSELQNQTEWMTLLEQFHARNPSEPISLRLLGEAYYNDKKYDLSLNLLKKLHDIDRCDYYSHYLMASIYETFEKSVEARDEYQLALRHLERNDHKYLSISDKLVKAQILKKLGRTTESLLVLNLILLRDPENPFALELSAGDYIDLRRLPLAKERLERLYAIKQDDSNILKPLSELYIRMGEYDQAKQTLRSYHEKTGGDYRSYHMYGNVLATLGDNSGSQRAYSEALRLIRSNEQ